MTRLNKQGWTLLTRFHSSVLSLADFPVKKNNFTILLLIDVLMMSIHDSSEYKEFHLTLRICNFQFSNRNLNHEITRNDFRLIRLRVDHSLL